MALAVVAQLLPSPANGGGRARCVNNQQFGWTHAKE